MSAPAPSCPVCGGVHLLDHPGGLLVFQHIAGCTLRDAEDATQANDLILAWCWYGECFTRDATATERLLLDALGFEVPDELDTALTYLTDTVRCRTWPPLKTKSTEGATAP